MLPIVGIFMLVGAIAAAVYPGEARAKLQKPVAPAVYEAREPVIDPAKAAVISDAIDPAPIEPARPAAATATPEPEEKLPLARIKAIEETKRLFFYPKREDNAATDPDQGSN